MKRLLLFAVALFALGIPSGAIGSPGDLAVVFRRAGRVEVRPAAATLPKTELPLGSTWKLFVYAYAVETGLSTPAYRCGERAAPDDEYCCDPGGSIERDAALAKSCGTFFQPSRLGIDGGAWRKFWESRANGEAAWLADLGNLRPEKRLRVESILAALDAVPEGARVAAGRALLPVLVDGYGQGAVTRLGGLVRLKTWTFDHPTKRGARIGGGAGWLVDGTPIWIGRSGASRNVLREDAGAIAELLPPPAGDVFGETCVAVDYFARYPLREVERLPARIEAAEGPLDGGFRLTFENGNALKIRSNGELILLRESGRPKIRGRMTLVEYVARVLDREADPNVVEAARALAIVARSWVIENASVEAGCLRVADDTRAQRVSPNPPTPAALSAARFAEGLVLKGVPVRYRLDREEPGVLAWNAAVAQARNGSSWGAILEHAFPGSRLATESGEEDCRPVPEAEHWLAVKIPAWRRRLSTEPGFEPPDGPLTLCALASGLPYSDSERLRVYVHDTFGREERITLAHEYLHLAFRFHPKGGDEAWIEKTARELAEGEGRVG